jgi:hypothetical protein
MKYEEKVSFIALHGWQQMKNPKWSHSPFYCWYRDCWVNPLLLFDIDEAYKLQITVIKYGEDRNNWPDGLDELISRGVY